MWGFFYLIVYNIYSNNCISLDLTHRLAKNILCCILTLFRLSYNVLSLTKKNLTNKIDGCLPSSSFKGFKIDSNN